MVKQITLDYGNVMEKVLGPGGLKDEELRMIFGRLQSARDNIERMVREGTIGFPALPDNQQLPEEIKKVVRKMSPGKENFVVIGIGGSALGNIALFQALNHPYHNWLSRQQRTGLKLFVPDNVDPDYLAGLTEILNFRRTIFNVISKSGTTAECLANYFVLRKILEKKVGPKNIQRHLIITTDPKKGFLRQQALKEKIVSFPVPENVGGRFSVLSAVGLVSAAFCGLNIDKILSGARTMAGYLREAEVGKNPAALYAAINYLYYYKGRRIVVMMPYSSRLYGLADWYRQLWAESLGKKFNRDGQEVRIGPTPIKALGVTDQHSQLQLYIEGPADKLLVFLSVAKFGRVVKITGPSDHYLSKATLNKLIQSEELASRLALTKAGCPNLTFVLPEISPQTIGELIYLLEMATAYAGELFGVNAFDQPGVETGKKLTYALLGRSGFEKELAEIAAWQRNFGSGSLNQYQC